MKSFEGDTDKQGVGFSWSPSCFSQGSGQEQSVIRSEIGTEKRRDGYQGVLKQLNVLELSRTL